MSKLLTYCVLKSAQLFTLKGTGNEQLRTAYIGTSYAGPIVC